MDYKYRAIIFDLDDTLIVAKTGIIFHQEVAQSRGYRVPSEKEMARYWGLDWERFINRLWPDVPFQEFKQAYIEYSKTHPRKYRLMPGTKKTLRNLKKRDLILGVLSNRSEKNIRDLLERLGVDLESFDIIQGTEDYVHQKPDPRAFDQILADLGKRGVLAQEIVYVGDTRFDIEASRGRDIKFIGVLSGVMDQDDFQSFNISDQDIIASIKDLPRWLKKYGRK